MNNREQCRADRVDRVLVFGDENAADFAAGGKAAESFTRLRAIQSALSQARAGQQVPTGRTALEVLFDALRMDLQNLTRTARAIAQEQPGFADAFRLPTPPTDGTLLTTADAFVDRLTVKAEDDDATKTRKTAMTAAFIMHGTARQLRDPPPSRRPSQPRRTRRAAREEAGAADTPRSPAAGRLSRAGAGAGERTAARTPRRVARHAFFISDSPPAGRG